MIVKDNKNKETLIIAGLFKFKIFILSPLDLTIKLSDFYFKIEYKISRKSISIKCN